MPSDQSTRARGPRSARIKGEVVRLHQVESGEEHRLSTGIAEFDRVLGGGIMRGSIVLVGGDPGVGKSTLMSQMCGRIHGGSILYVTGEESLRQIKLRSERLGLAPDDLQLMAETNLTLIVEAMKDISPDVAVVDSIQTVYLPGIESAPGSVAQVRECTALLMQCAKTSGTSVFIVGHVTKEGAIAGPKVLEHMVDTVLQFEGERTHLYRILRTTKNRYGSTNEIGVFEMAEKGLIEVTNPSSVFLSERRSGVSGSAVAATLEGTRPILVEAQALVTATSYGVPQRSATGFDYKRLQMLLAVLEKRMGMGLGACDVFVNIAGGVRVDDPAVDLAVAIAVVSSFRDVPADSGMVAVGEIGLGGEIRAAVQIDQRVAEASKLGFKTILVPEGNLSRLARREGVNVLGVSSIADAIAAAT